MANARISEVEDNKSWLEKHCIKIPITKKLFETLFNYHSYASKNLLCDDYLDAILTKHASLLGVCIVGITYGPYCLTVRTVPTALALTATPFTLFADGVNKLKSAPKDEVMDDSVYIRTNEI